MAHKNKAEQVYLFSFTSDHRQCPEFQPQLLLVLDISVVKLVVTERRRNDNTTLCLQPELHRLSKNPSPPPETGYKTSSKLSLRMYWAPSSKILSFVRPDGLDLCTPAYSCFFFCVIRDNRQKNVMPGNELDKWARKFARRC